MRIDSRVAAEHHPGPGAMGGAEAVALDLGGLAVLAQIVLGDPELRARRLGEVGVVDVHRQPGPVLDRQTDALGVDHRGMFDRVDAGADGIRDARGTVGMGGDLEAPHMRLIGDGGQLGQGHLLLTGFGIAREDAAGRADLDHLGPVFADLAHGMAGVLDAVGVEWIGLGHGVRHAGDIAMAAGGSERGARGNDPRPFDEAAVDGLTQGHIGEIGSAEVTNGGEARHEVGAGMDDLKDGSEVVGIVQLVPARDIGRRGQVDVHVDQARQQGQARQVEAAGIRRQAGRHGRPDRSDPAIGDHDHGIFDIAAAFDIHHPRRGDHKGVGEGRGRKDKREGGGGGQTFQHGGNPQKRRRSWHGEPAGATHRATSPSAARTGRRR